MPADDSFSFGSLIKPGDAHRHAIMRELSTRAAREHGPWLYKGEASYIMAHGQYFQGRVLPDAHDDLVGEMTFCHRNALAAALERPELRYFTGFYMVGRQVGQHSWCVDPMGDVVEVTYPTKGLEPGAMTAETLDGFAIPWLPPERWAYFGLEFDATFVSALLDRYGDWLPILDCDPPLAPFHTDAMSHVYSPRGWPIP